MSTSLTRDAVGQVARALIVLNGQTTTLEVKTQLRKMGYFAKQNQVRELMLDITSKDGDIQYKDTGIGYRQYFGPTLTFTNPAPHVYNNKNICITCGCSQGAITYFEFDCNPTPKDVQNTVSSSVNASVQVQTPSKPHRDHIPCDYVVQDEYGSDRHRFFNVTRGQAKHLWSKATGRYIFEARTKKA